MICSCQAPPTATASSLSGCILQGLQCLRAAGVAPFYIWMFDEPWRLLLSFWSEAEALLGGTCLLEPTFAAYHLR